MNSNSNLQTFALCSFDHVDITKEGIIYCKFRVLPMQETVLEVMALLRDAHDRVFYAPQRLNFKYIPKEAGM